MTNPDTAKTRAGLARDDLFTVVHDPFMTETAKLRRHRAAGDDLSGDRRLLPRYGTYYMQYGQRAVEPQGEAWSNLRLTQTLAARMGLTDPVFQMSPPEMLRNCSAMRAAR